LKDLKALWRELAVETAGWCDTSALRDIQTFTERTKHEGDSFATITLPSYGKSLFRALEAGKVADDMFLGFERRAGLPQFLGGFLQQVFGPDGALLDEPSVDCIDAIHQLTSVFAKIERPCSNKRVSRAMRQFVETEVEIGSVDPEAYARYLPHFAKASTLLWADVFSFVESSLTDTHRSLRNWVGHDPTAARVTPLPDRSVPPSLITDVVVEAAAEAGILGYKGRYRQVDDLLSKVIENPALPGSQFSIRSGINAAFETLVPKHGPGATADRLRGNAKFNVTEWSQRLEGVFPYGDYSLPQLATEAKLDCVQFHEPGAERPVKVIAVPKTLKTPRIIAIEPTSQQYMQQAVSHGLVHAIESWSELSITWTGKDSALGRFFIGFEKQEPNRLLALEGSLNGSLATLDLSEASDRVLNRHVEFLFARFPRLSEAIQATRSLKACVPGHGTVSLAKFASMGSALCFPVEAMVFITIIFAAIADERQVPLNRELMFDLRGKVRVYGDDIIVPVEHVSAVILALEAFGLKVNKDKSFWNGKFRESCGGDFYDGRWITPVRLRKDLPRTLHDVSETVGLVALRNNLYWRGYWKTAGRIDDWLRLLLKGAYPIVDETAACLGRESVLPYQAERYDRHTMQPLVRAAVAVSKPPLSKADGEGSLLKFLIKRGNLPSQDPEHLERQGRPSAVRIITRGTSPF